MFLTVPLTPRNIGRCRSDCCSLRSAFWCTRWSWLTNWRSTRSSPSLSSLQHTLTVCRQWSSSCSCCRADCPEWTDCGVADLQTPASHEWADAYYVRIWGTLELAFFLLSNQLVRSAHLKVVIQGIHAPLATPIRWLARTLASPDNFLYIAVRKIE